MKTTKTLVAIIATAIGTGCTLEVPKDHTDRQTTGADRRIIWYDAPVHLAERQFAIGDVPPYGTVDYCILSERGPGDAEWKIGRKLANKDPRYKLCEIALDKYDSKNNGGK